jgi:carboxylesterase type B
LDLFHRIVTTARSWRGQVIEAEERAKAGAPAFVYQLDFEQAKHTDDIGLSFGTLPNPSLAQQAMSDRVMDAFVRFARSGNPNGNGNAPWPKAPAVFLQDNHWKTALTGAQFASAHQCGFWAPILPQR